MKHLILVANCFPVKGFKRSIICDTTRFRYEFIPNSLYEFLKKYNRCVITEIREEFSDSDWAIVETYLQFLYEKDFIFYTDQPLLFPDVEISWESSLEITNAVIDFDQYSDHDLEKIFAELNALRCESVEFRIFNERDQNQIQKIIDNTLGSSLRSVHLITKYNKDHTRAFFEELIKSNRRIMSITIHSTPSDFNDRSISQDGDFFNITFTKQQCNDESHCGAISKLNFSTSITMFMESHIHNSCLNKKVAIDREGFIKNCPSSKDSFGHHKENMLGNIILLDKFRQYWDITKDQVSICQDCEFRYICTDCRVYIQDDMNIFSKPKKCDYDPYAAVWMNMKQELKVI